MALNKHFDSATVERRVSEKWIGNKAFRAGANAKDGQPSYTIMIPLQMLLAFYIWGMPLITLFRIS